MRRPLRRTAAQWPAFASKVSLLGVLRLVAGRARAETSVALVGEAAVAGAPLWIGRLVAGRTRALAPITVIGHAGVTVRGRCRGHGQGGSRDSCKQGETKRNGSKGFQHS